MPPKQIWERRRDMVYAEPIYLLLLAYKQELGMNWAQVGAVVGRSGDQLRLIRDKRWVTRKLADLIVSALRKPPPEVPPKMVPARPIYDLLVRFGKKFGLKRSEVAGILGYKSVNTLFYWLRKQELVKWQTANRVISRLAELSLNRSVLERERQIWEKSLKEKEWLSLE